MGMLGGAIAELSKTARASMRVETQGVSRSPVAWVFEHKATLQTKLYKTCYVRSEAEALAAQILHIYTLHARISPRVPLPAWMRWRRT
jgi:hypothetical protein